MKLLHVSPFYPPHVGGLQSHAQGFDQHLTQAGISITTFAPHIPATAPAVEKNLHLSIVRYPAIEIIPNYPLPALWQPKFWRQLRWANPRAHDIIISRTRFFLPALFATLLARILHKPYLHIEHGSDFVSLANPITRLFARWYDLTLGRFVLRSATAIVANSAASARFVTRLSGREATIIHRGIDKETIAAIKPANLTTTPYNLLRPSEALGEGGPPTTSTITFVGRLIDGKGVDDLIRAIKLLATNHPRQTHLVIIGSGPREKSLKELARKLNLTEHVTFLGERSFDETISILKSTDVFVNPSHTEGLPTSVIEAALCKVPIVATNVGGTTEIVTDNVSALLVPPKQPELLARKLEQLLSDRPLQERLAAAAYQEVSQKFSWEKTTEKYRQLFDSILKT